jgi:aryl-alcohol dehydrogenase-like predicted oxidoreductase
MRTSNLPNGSVQPARVPTCAAPTARPCRNGALQFLLRHPAVASVVVGMRSRDEVETNARR